MYIELHARSAFSFLEGASVPEELAEVCAQHQMPAMALLDRDGVYGAPRFYLAANKLKIKAHIGAEIASYLHSSKHNIGAHWRPQFSTARGSQHAFLCSAPLVKATKTSAAW